MKQRAVALVLLALLLGCRSQQEQPAPKAEFGIFFGGQIQERDFIPFELNSAKQRIGFRIEFSAPLRQATEIQWQTSRPGKRDPKQLQVSRPDRRVTETDSAVLAEGEQRFERQLPLSPGDPLGLWNLRVVAGDRVLIDRPFTLYDADERARAKANAREADAGL